MEIIDTHCHLFLPEFDIDRDEIIETCQNEGIWKMINPNVDDTTLNDVAALVNKYPESIYAAYGLHPSSVKSDYKEKINIIRDFSGNQKMLAIGEIGIDLYWDTTYLKEQQNALEYQFQWAIDLNLPVIIHMRNAFEQTYEIIRVANGIKGVLHAFTGTLEQAFQIIDENLYLGIGGIVTFKNGGLDKVIKEIPLQNIVLETDSPYLTPVPFRGKRNQPAYLKYIAQKIAEIKEIPVEEVANVTTNNALSLFQL
jgi:TatD DNase family protein